MSLITGEYYHIYNKGVEGRSTFIDGADYFRFLLGLRGFNDTKVVYHLHRYCQLKSLERLRGEIEPLVEIICYTLMPNHYHLLIRQKRDNGISKFMQKLGTGYTKYFNKRYQRSGVLFQGVYKYKHIHKNEYLMHLSRYIHLNALSLLQKQWIDKGIKKERDAWRFLMRYKWHSLPFWLENKPCMIRLNSSIVLEQFSAKRNYREFIMDWSNEDFEQIKDIIIE